MKKESISILISKRKLQQNIDFFVAKSDELLNQNFIKSIEVVKVLKKFHYSFNLNYYLLYIRSFCTLETVLKILSEVLKIIKNDSYKYAFNLSRKFRGFQFGLVNLRLQPFISNLVKLGLVMNQFKLHTTE